MSSNVIAFPSSHRIRHSGSPTPPSLPLTPHDASSRDSGPRKDPDNQAEDGRRKKDARSRSVEPNIQEIRGKNGTASYRVQIRKTVDGKAISITETFSSLKFAKRWKVKKLAEIELQGVDFVAKSDKTVSDAIIARLAAHQSLGRSAIQQLTWIKESYFGNKKVCDLTMEVLLELADFMLAEERLPQTVAGYLTILCCATSLLKG